VCFSASGLEGEERRRRRRRRRRRKSRRRKRRSRMNVECCFCAFCKHVYFVWVPGGDLGVFQHFLREDFPATPGKSVTQIHRIKVKDPPSLWAGLIDLSR
jgi:hypothetical protein